MYNNTKDEQRQLLSASRQKLQSHSLQYYMLWYVCMYVTVTIDNTRIPWIGNAHKNFLTILLTVRQFVSILFVYTPATVLGFVVNFQLLNCVWLPSMIADCAGDEFLATNCK